MKIVLGIFIFGFVVIGNIQATTIIVPTDQLTIQAGIYAANDGDTVLVLPEVYPENIDFLGKSITVKSSLGPTATTIAAPNSGSVVTFSSGENVSSVLEGFTIIHGRGTPDIDSHGVIDTAFFGGGIFIKHSSPTIIGNMITFNYVIW